MSKNYIKNKMIEDFVDAFAETIKEEIDKNGYCKTAFFEVKKKDIEDNKKYLVIIDDEVCFRYELREKFKVVTKEELRKMRTEPYVVDVICGGHCSEDVLNFDDIAKFLEISDEEIAVLEKFEVIK